MAATNELKKIYIKQLSFEPAQDLLRLVKETKFQITDEAFAKRLDKLDELKNLREEFYYPKMKHLPLVDPSLVNEEMDCVYLCGNSLGLQPKEADIMVKQEMEKWQQIFFLFFFRLQL